MMTLLHRRGNTNPSKHSTTTTKETCITSTNNDTIIDHDYSSSNDEEKDHHVVIEEEKSLLKNKTSLTSIIQNWIVIKRKLIFIILGIIELLVIIWVLYKSLTKRNNKYNRNVTSFTGEYYTSYIVTVIIMTFLISLPILVAIITGLGLDQKQQKQQKNQYHIHQQLIPLAIVTSILSSYVPTYLSSALAAIGVVGFGLASRPNDNNSNNKKNMIEETKKNDDDSNKLSTKSISSSSFSFKKNKFCWSSLKLSSITSSAKILTVCSVFLCVTIFLIENFFVWVVSATYYPSHNHDTLPKPLQDNGHIVLQYILNTILNLKRKDIISIRRIFNVQWALVTGLSCSLITVELYRNKLRRHLYTYSMRILLTLGIARFIRMISFCITVLPNQIPTCYFNRFPSPPPPDNWYEWILIGMLPRTNGGCNDLIISGHATVTSTFACAIISIVNKPLFTIALWMLVIIDYSIEIYEGFHYSVDMWLGAILVTLIYKRLEFIENGTLVQSLLVVKTNNTKSKDDNDNGNDDDESHSNTNDDNNNNNNQQQQQRQHQMQQKEIENDDEFKSITNVTKIEFIQYSLPAFIGYLQVNKIFLSKEIANYIILAYILGTAYQLARYGIQQYTQHFLFCLLYIALGIYL